jgi:lysophospholipase L1-like esterase
MPLTSNKLSYLALGDSYTIGEAVYPSQSFPFQVAAQLRGMGLDLEIPQVIAKTGWTTSELLDAIQVSNLSGTFDLVTLLIGVNNQYRGESPKTYQQEFKELVAIALRFAGGNASHVFVVSIPDWGLTPYGRESGRTQALISREIDEFNKINKQISDAAGVCYIDITPSSRLVATDLRLVAEDGLHPSEKMYQDWARRLTAQMAPVLQAV